MTDSATKTTSAAVASVRRLRDLARRTGFPPTGDAELLAVGAAVSRWEGLRLDALLSPLVAFGRGCSRDDDVRTIAFSHSERCYSWT